MDFNVIYGFLLYDVWISMCYMDFWRTSQLNLSYLRSQILHVTGDTGEKKQSIIMVLALMKLGKNIRLHGAKFSIQKSQDLRLFIIKYFACRGFEPASWSQACMIGLWRTVGSRGFESHAQI